MKTSVAISATMAGQKQETTFHIHLQGRVQGVGFRPFVYQKAIAMGLQGAVSNGLDGVHIWLQTQKEKAENFLKEILNSPPALSIITGHSCIQVPEENFAGFTILTKYEDTAADLWITPDLTMCDTCRKELENPTDRRYRYPFITCTQCGPRYSVMQTLPFERHLTTMLPFLFCGDCQREFDDSADRRFYAQTMSCPACGVKMEFTNALGNRMGKADDNSIIQSICEALHKGKIIAVKGIGGFLLITDATNESGIMRLRQRKHRPSKPFAIMYPDIEHLAKDTELSQTEKKLLSSLEAPIVLLAISEKMKKLLATQALAPGLDKLGIMLPYAPLLYLIGKTFQKPVVATSGNVSGAPICFTNADALNSLGNIADFFVLHNRDIVAPQDDSVISAVHDAYPAILLRRSRGFAPACEVYQTQGNKSILACGALMKSSFAVAHRNRVYVSQYLGNTDSFEAQQAYRHTLGHMQQLLKFTPEIILTDAHPLYFSHHLAQEMALLYNIPMQTIQHHKAHFAAILGERGLINQGKPVLGIVWDGTGLGEDGNSWGGEFFIYDNNCIQRLNHFEYFPYLLGDKMATEPRISALSIMHHFDEKPDGLRAMFTQQEWQLYHQMLREFNGIYTSSIGRLFDAAACLITGISRQSYEGEAAMRLQALANDWCRKNGLRIKDNFLKELQPEAPVPTSKILLQLKQAIDNGDEPSYIAATFHATIVDIIGTMAQHYKIPDICFSGGVFQNTLLVQMLIEKYGQQYQLHFHRSLSPNDENISFGQLIYADQQMQL